ncbi:M12 family metallopeptidase [Roseivirga sp. BDSF3-8]|uniref:M12 family metallopeptidase n=1 Tax=Roseivirga sp. BDSF3-8 TaxID=3241598 RepID=UPI003531D05D
MKYEAQTDYSEVEKNKQYCRLPPQPERDLPDDILPRRAEIIIINGRKWVNGTQIHYCFWDHTKHNCLRSWTAASEEEKDVVRDSFREWKEVGIGLEFIEVEDPFEAEVRIGFQQDNRSWSYIGTTVLQIPQNARTMNFGWSLTRDWYGKETALHEIGHTLGFPHAHQNPNAGIVWNEQRVLEYFRGSPNFWDDDTIHHNILRKVRQSEVNRSEWDSNSIMQYNFQADLIDSPPPYNQEGIRPEAGLSDTDREFIRKFYPSLAEEDYVELRPFRSEHATLQPGDQMDFIIKPERSRTYIMQTFGPVDTLLVLFEKQGSENRYLAGDDDAGFERNARITFKLLKGREYILRLRFYYSSQSGDTAVMLW